MASREVGFVVTEEYRSWINDVKMRIKQSQIKASVKNMLNGGILF